MESCEKCWWTIKRAEETPENFHHVNWNAGVVVAGDFCTQKSNMEQNSTWLAWSGIRTEKSVGDGLTIVSRKLVY